ncbi:uncharacterized protein LOC6725999 [Drosophila simulans]|uniref:uncharacterized protein LOC6725999 n=1 Tax=Drosophila simulans TaxID=7240 RepID=UPI00078AE3B3|nr:uncharacterized protein LOC6725999 [Drosophila simulans]KMZ09827.1 uncharacterized protein Dsimw501_GD15815 [Drosophila simulans]
MSSIEWVGDMLYYVMRTYLGLTAPSCNAHFLIDVLGKIEHFIYFIEFSMMIMRRPRNFKALTDSQANRLQLYNCLSMLRTWAKVIYALVSVHALIHIKTHYISIAIVISGIVLAIDMIFLAINGLHGKRTLRPARILWISLSCCTWVPGILNELIIYLYN